MDGVWLIWVLFVWYIVSIRLKLYSDVYVHACAHVYTHTYTFIILLAYVYTLIQACTHTLPLVAYTCTQNIPSLCILHRIVAPGGGLELVPTRSSSSLSKSSSLKHENYPDIVLVSCI